MESSERKEGGTSNRILLAAIVIVVVTPILLHLIEELVDGNIDPNPQILIWAAAILALIADRIYLYFRSR